MTSIERPSLGELLRHVRDEVLLGGMDSDEAIADQVAFGGVHFDAEELRIAYDR